MLQPKKEKISRSQTAEINLIKIHQALISIRVLLKERVVTIMIIKVINNNNNNIENNDSKINNSNTSNNDNK